MTSVVVHRKTGERFVVLGLDVVRPFSEERRFSQSYFQWSKVVAVANAAGDIVWHPADDLRVESVNGQPLDFLLSKSESPYR